MFYFVDEEEGDCFDLFSCVKDGELGVKVTADCDLDLVPDDCAVGFPEFFVVGAVFWEEGEGVSAFFDDESPVGVSGFFIEEGKLSEVFTGFGDGKSVEFVGGSVDDHVFVLR